MMKFLVLLAEWKNMRVWSDMARQTARRWENNSLFSKYNLRLGQSERATRCSIEEATCRCCDTGARDRVSVGRPVGPPTLLGSLAMLCAFGCRFVVTLLRTEKKTYTYFFVAYDPLFQARAHAG